MEYVHNKFKKQEEKDWEDFKVVITALTESNISKFGETPYGTYFDVSGTTTNSFYSENGEEYPLQIEIKGRKKGADKFKDCFIEPRKLENLLTHPENGAPIYINMIGGPDNVYVFRPDQIPKDKIEFHPNVLINGERVNRYGIPWDWAWHFVRKEGEEEHKLITKGA